MRLPPIPASHPGPSNGPATKAIHKDGPARQGNDIFMRATHIWQRQPHPCLHFNLNDSTCFCFETETGNMTGINCLFSGDRTITNISSMCNVLNKKKCISICHVFSWSRHVIVTSKQNLGIKHKSFNTWAKHILF